MVGKSLGPYKILQQLGKGGMGEVWLAEDTRLDRKVAVKVLPGELASDVDRSSRFEQEAKAAAALNHPHIAAVFDVGVATAEGNSSPTHYMVQEYLQGATLRDTIASGTLAQDKALALCIEIGEALRAAHRAGIVHRDLKPDNVFVTTDGHAKVLDFGLAKLTETALPSGVTATASPTMTMAGQMLGTAGYMAPEQVRGEDVDERVDLFALGCVLYETITGRQAFGGSNVHESLSRILTGAPDPMGERSGPGRLSWVLDKLLAKDREQRYQTAGDVVVDLRRLAAATDGDDEEPGATRAEAPTRRSPIPWIGVAFLALLAGAFGAWHLKGTPAATGFSDVRFDIVLVDNLTFAGTYNRILAISPDSRRIAFTAAGGGAKGLWIRTMNQAAPLVLPSTGGARSPAFSPDSKQVAFWANGHVNRVAVDETVPVVVGPFRERPLGIHWADDGYIYIGRANQGIWRLPDDGGEAEQVLALEAGEHAHGPELLPGGEWILFTLGQGVRAWAGGSIVAQSLKTNERRVLVPHGREARYVRSGYLTYVLDGVLFAAPFDADRVEVVGRAIAMENSVYTSMYDETGAAGYDVSDDGVLAFAPSAGFGARDISLVWVDQQQGETTLPLAKRRFQAKRLSPDQKSIATQVDDVEGTHIWLFPVDRDGGQRLTTTGRNRWPTWSHDGRYVYFASDRDGEFDIWRRAADLSTPAEQVLAAEGAQIPSTVSSDGEWLYYTQMAPSNSDIARLRLTGEPVSEVLVESPADEFEPRISADGRLFCFCSDETGRWDIHVMEIETGRRWIVTPDGGYSPTWTRDGKRILFFGGGTGGLFAVSVTTDPDFSAGEPQRVFLSDYRRYSQDYDVSADGRRLLIGATEVDDTAVETRERITVVLDWFDELERRVP